MRSALYLLQMLAFFLFCQPVLFSQNYFTCENAFEICSKGIFRFEFPKGPESKTTVSSCLSEPRATTWIAWEVAEAGYFTFTITPEKPADDVDFAVFKITSKDCEKPKLLRCMLSGQVIGYPEMSLPCLGPTGLTTAERWGKRECEGCSEGDNNFLPALKCEKSERYALAIQNYDNATGSFTVDFCGSARLPCDSVFCEELTKNKRGLPQKEEVLFTSVFSGENLPLYFYNVQPQSVSALVRDAAGKVRASENFQVKDDQTEYLFRLNDVPAGEYFIEIKLSDRTVSGRLRLNL